MRGKFLRTLLFLSLAVIIGLTFNNIQSVYASEKDEVSGKHKSQIENLKTPLHSGDTFETIQVEWVSLMKDLATGKVPNDEFTWRFEDALFYTEGETKLAAKQAFSECVSNLSPGCLSFFLNNTVTGIFNLGAVTIRKTTRCMTTANGKKIYRCAMTSVRISDDDWCSPYGDACSRKKALRYYNKCKKQIKAIVSEVIDARQPNGEPLTDEQRLKKIHDWLIVNANYAREKLSLHKANTGKKEYQFDHLWNEYGAIVDGEAVCQGYTYAFKVIVDELARQTGADIVCEEASNSNHSWIRVKLNGEWYNIDTTYDEGMTESLSNIVDDCFLVSDDTFAMLWSKFDLS